MTKPAARFAVGIDLGTTNSVIAYAPLPADGVEPGRPEVLPTPQLVAAATVESRSTLPSFLYLASDAEKTGKAYDLPWAKARDYAVGHLAQKQSADVPTRTVAGAKSWLAYPKVDRRTPILPWNAPADVVKVSPVEASRRYIEHLVATWNAAHPDAPLKDQQVVLTVPASFDAAARDLTREAAIAAGLPDDFTLLEEPQAALYSWLADQGKNWRKQLKIGDTLLVCDVGGGTTDFTLISVAEEDGQLTLRRLAVGNHTLVGGDNMDLALAHHATTAFAAKGTNLNPWQSVALWHSCRQAKEALLGTDPPKKHPVTVLGRGSKLVGGTVSVDLDAKTVRDLLLDGFFPQCAISDKPARRPASGFREIGLPYETDAAVTKHLAAFLTVNATGEKPEASSQKSDAVRPTHVLFNGGVFKAPALRDRLLEVLSSWFAKKESPTVLGATEDLDFAVARGAAYYAAAKTGRGVRIRGGAARAYYVGIETAGLAIPGAPRPLRALCVVPQGMEEGTQTDVPSGDIGLVVGEPATFRFFSSATRRTDKPGDLIEQWKEDEIQETDSLEANLPSAENAEEGYVPVRFQSKLTELGVFELWCLSQAANQRWKLEFSVREQS
ncbi:MAG TPA: Hsp70 family protein [Tepidisphaeraceae bacterium]|nr:Hsp70 family protein [Tepidisphaeraceae bacterium]